MRNFDLIAALEAADDDEYDEIKKFFGGSKYDLDFEELWKEKETLWETNTRRLHIDLKDNGNIFEITVSDVYENMYDGYCCVYERDSAGLGSATMEALKEFIRINDLVV